VTGYSLGGHLATAFTILHQDDLTTFGAPLIKETYTFNGAGVGIIAENTNLQQILDTFKQHCVSGENGDIFTYALSLEHYNNLKETFKNRENITADKILQEIAILPGVVQLPQALGNEIFLLTQALSRMYDIANEAERVDGIPSGAGGAPAQEVKIENIVAVSLDYQLAVMRAAQETESFKSGPVSGSGAAYFGRTIVSGGPWPNFYDVYGEAGPSAVANSQIHYGTAIPVSIEAQPLHRGIYLPSVVLTSAWNFGIKLLVNNFGLNDFGDTHSLVLLVDSLSVQNLFAQLDTEFSLEEFVPIMQAATNAKGESVPFFQGKSEGDALENLVNVFSHMFNTWDSVETKKQFKLKGDNRGNTWHEIDDKDGFTGRESLHKAIKAIAESPAFKALIGKAEISLVNNNLNTSAKEEFGHFIALQALSPFIIHTDDEAALEALKAAHNETKNRWEDDLAKREIGDTSYSYNYTNQWYADRAELLSYVQQIRTENIPTGAIIQGPQKLHYQDMENDIDILVGISTHRIQILFGNDEDNLLTGAGFADRLYGGAGDDTLTGLGRC